MEDNAKALMLKCELRGIEVTRYGDDLPTMAEQELEMNTWAVRFLYLHMLRDGLCLRPPYSMVELTGFGASATNAGDASGMGPSKAQRLSSHTRGVAAGRGKP